MTKSWQRLKMKNRLENNDFKFVVNGKRRKDIEERLKSLANKYNVSLAVIFREIGKHWYEKT
jgi:hypothetical protein